MERRNRSITAARALAFAVARTLEEMCGLCPFNAAAPSAADSPQRSPSMRRPSYEGAATQYAELLGAAPELMHCFYNPHRPTITLQQFAERLMLYMRCSTECFVFALCYLRRIAAKGIVVSTHCVHSLFVAALVVAVKMRDDTAFTMGYYGQVGGITASQLCKMEFSLLGLIDYACNVSPKEYTLELKRVIDMVPPPPPSVAAAMGPPWWHVLPHTQEMTCSGSPLTLAEPSIEQSPTEAREPKVLAVVVSTATS